MSINILSESHKNDDYPINSLVDIKNLWKMEDNHFWHSERNKFILKYMQSLGLKTGSKILEIGCGSGAVLTFLAKKGYKVSGIDTAHILLKKAHERCSTAELYQGWSHELDDQHLSQYDAICYFDVLEHLDRPEEILRKDLRLLKKGAFVIATVPASKSLWSQVDVLSGHKKRYELGELKTMFTELSLNNPQEYSFMASLYPFLHIHRYQAKKSPNKGDSGQDIMKENVRLPSSFQTKVFEFLLTLERKVLFPKLKHFSSSIIASART